MPKKRKDKKKPNVNSRGLAHVISHRRYQVSRLMASGYSTAEIAQKLKVHYSTIQRDVDELEDQWYWRARLNTEKVKQNEIRQLESARQAAWRAFYENANRHGEVQQTGYLDLVLRATKQLHELLRINDPLVDQGAIGPESKAKVIEVTVRTREQVDLIERGSIDFEDLATLEKG
ncbi:MAG: hypothetical protein FJ276_09065 [Planctomycetes bacterium]|nr:hypothetical protein [Planctomycetota bacterium]